MSNLFVSFIFPEVSFSGQQLKEQLNFSWRATQPRQTLFPVAFYFGRFQAAASDFSFSSQLRLKLEFLQLEVFLSMNRSFVYKEVDSCRFCQACASWQALGVTPLGRFAFLCLGRFEVFSDFLKLASSHSRFAVCICLLVWWGSLPFSFNLPNPFCPFRSICAFFPFFFLLFFFLFLLFFYASIR